MLSGEAIRPGRPTFSASHGQCGQTIFESLFKTKKFQNGKIDGWMKSQAAFVWTNRTIVLNSVTTVDLLLAFIVNPCDTELDNSLWFAYSLNDWDVFRMSVNHRPEGLKDLKTSLMKLRIVRISSNDLDVICLQIMVQFHITCRTTTRY